MSLLCSLNTFNVESYLTSASIIELYVNLLFYLTQDISNQKKQYYFKFAIILHPAKVLQSLFPHDSGRNGFSAHTCIKCDVTTLIQNLQIR